MFVNLPHNDILVLENSLLEIHNSNFSYSTFETFITSSDVHSSKEWAVNIKITGTIFDSLRGHTFLRSSSVSNVDIRSTMFSQNRYRGKILIMENINSIMILTSVTFVENEIFNGYAIDCGKILLKNCRFVQNVFNKSILSSHTLTVFDTHFKENCVGSIIEGKNGSIITLTKSTIIENKIDHVCLLRQNTKFTMEGCLVKRNIVKNSFFTERALLKIGIFNTEIKKYRMSSSMSVRKSAVSMKNTIITSNTFNCFEEGEILTNLNDFIMIQQESHANFHDLKISSNINDQNCVGKLLRIEKSELRMLDSRIQIWSFDLRFPNLSFMHDGLTDRNINIAAAGSREIVIIRSTFFKQVTNVIFMCPRRYQIKSKILEMSNMKVVCTPCPRGTYCLDQTPSSYQIICLKKIKPILFTIPHINNAITDSYISKIVHNVECLECPFGGICSGLHIKNRDNFYGFIRYVRNLTLVSFVPCPENYCCSKESNPCQTIKSCGAHRTGRLCGQCKEKYFLNYFSNECRSIKSCTWERMTQFWILYLITNLLISIVLIFSQTFKEMVASLFGLIKKTCCRVYKKSTSEKDRKKKSEIELKDRKRKKKKQIFEKQQIQKEEMSKSALFGILISFYQLKSVISVKMSTSQSLFIDNIFNLDFIIRGKNKLNSWCPSASLTVVGRELLMGYFSTLTMLSCVVITFIVSKLVDRISPIKSSSRSEDDLKVGLYVLLSFSYKNIVKTALALIHCRQAEGFWFLYIDGTITCYNSWQAVNIAFIVLWVIPFPFAVAFGYILLRNQKIPLWTFLCGLLIPFGMCFVFARDAFSSKERRHHLSQSSYNINRKIKFRFQEIFEEPYKSSFIWWEAWRLLERFVVTAFSIFIINPVLRTIYLAPILIFFLYFHFRMDPFKESMGILRQLDMVSYFCLCIHLVINSLRSVSYIYSLHDDELMISIEKAFSICEEIVSPLWYLILSMVGNKLIAKFKNRSNSSKFKLN